jgi:hypothetical protein
MVYYNFISSTIRTILNQDNTILNYKVICDQTNNPPYTKNITAEVYIKKINNQNIQHFSFLIEDIEIKKLRFQRKEKLNKICTTQNLK